MCSPIIKDGAEHVFSNNDQLPAKLVSPRHSIIKDLKDQQEAFMDVRDIQCQETVIADKKRIPDQIWDMGTQCEDYQNCLTQTGTSFGFVPLTPLKMYNGPTVEWNTIQDIIQAHKIVAKTGLFYGS